MMPMFRIARRMWKCDTCAGPIFKGWQYVQLGRGRFHDFCMPCDHDNGEGLTGMVE